MISESQRNEMRILCSRLLAENGKVNLLFTKIINLKLLKIDVLKEIKLFSHFSYVISIIDELRDNHIKLINSSLNELKTLFNRPIDIDKKTQDILIFSDEKLTKSYLEFEKMFDRLKGVFSELNSKIKIYDEKFLIKINDNTLNHVHDELSLKLTQNQSALHLLVKPFDNVKNELINFKLTFLKKEKVKLLDLLKTYEKTISTLSNSYKRAA